MASLSYGPGVEKAARRVAVLVAPPDGVAVLREVFQSLQGAFPGAVVILLHEGTGGERGVADNLNVTPGFMVLPGLDGVMLRDGHGYVVQAGANLTIGADGRLTKALAGDESLQASLASRYACRGIAVALTALDEGEIEAFRRVRSSGGHTVALDEADRLWADSRGPRVVADIADEHLSTTALGPRLISLASDLAKPEWTPLSPRRSNFWSLRTGSVDQMRELRPSQAPWVSPGYLPRAPRPWSGTRADRRISSFRPPPKENHHG